MQTSTEPLPGIWKALGIADDYGTSPQLPRFREAVELVDTDANIVGRVQRLAPETARAWSEMKRAAMEDAVELLMVSGFRSISYQVDLIRNKLAAGQAIEAILKVNAAPGFSEHHTGHAIDIATSGFRPLTEDFEQSDAFAWLTGNAARFGFRMSYPRDNVYGFCYEPWHWARL
jgi:zinc D-Ala-D-Ala carboxypeptidase